MTAIDNGVGETIPDQITVRLVFDDESRLVDCDAPRGSRRRETWQASAATMGTEIMYDSWACVARDPIGSEQYNTLARRRPVFVYMDCGRWGGNMPGGQRNFAMVWGTWAALCNFVPQSGPVASVNANAEPLNQLIASLTGPDSSVEVIKRLWSPTPIEPDWRTIYVFVGDLHLPIVRSRPHATQHTSGSGTWREYESDGPAMGRYEYTARDTDGEGMVRQRDRGRILGPRAQTWFRRYLAGDIFQGAARDLTQFANLLGRSSMRQRIHLVQAGDMYDFWIGLDRFFQEQTGHRVVLQQGAEQFVDYWTGRTNDLFPDLIIALTTTPVGQRSWVAGNHDNYLRTYTPGGLPSRVRQIRRGGIFVEHGQRGDPQNRDGAVDGHSATNRVFEDPSMRSWDPNRRDYWTTTAAISFAYNSDFGIYVMAHTHSPFLTKIYLDISRRGAGPSQDAGMPAGVADSPDAGPPQDDRDAGVR